MFTQLCVLEAVGIYLHVLKPKRDLNSLLYIKNNTNDAWKRKYNTLKSSFYMICTQKAEQWKIEG